MNLTPNDIIAPLFIKKDCKDCKCDTAKYGRKWRWCENPERFKLGKFYDAIEKAELNKNRNCPIFIYKPTLGRRIKKYLRKHIKWCYWHWRN